MVKLPFYIVDVFAERKYEGNPLAVIRCTRTVSDEEMQHIANEMNYSETTFILSDEKRDGGYDVRIFTPQNELPFAGHPTLGTAYVIAREIEGKPTDKVQLNLKVGPIPVTFQGDGDALWMRQNQPEFGELYDQELMAGVLGIPENQIDQRYPIQSVSTGIPFILVPLLSLESVRSCRFHIGRFRENFGDTVPVLVFCPETYHPGNDLNVRVFVDVFGVPEDPATGSGNGCLAGYLVKHRYFGEHLIQLKVEQGYEINRPSLLELQAEESAEGIDVRIGGKVVPVSEGFLL